MIYKTVEELLLEKMPFAPTPSQREAIEVCAEYMEDGTELALMLLKGYAGTGKTLMMRTITQVAKVLGYDVLHMATTGRAAKQLAQTTGERAVTIHRQIYQASASFIEEGGQYRVGRMGKRPRPLLFIVDEASMISGQSTELTPFGSGNLLDDLFEHVFSAEGSKLIMVGDMAQLPPVGHKLSEALDAEALRSRYGMQVYEAELCDVVRQAEGSEILRCATDLRLLLEDYADVEEGEQVEIHLSPRRGADVVVLDPEENAETIYQAYRKWGQEETLVVTPSNKRALGFNLAIRQQVLDYEDRLVSGERLMVARNNYFHCSRPDRSDFIANGEVVELRRVYKHHAIYDLEYADASIYLPERDEEREVRLLLTGLADEGAQRTTAQRRALYDALVVDYSHHPSIVDVRRAIRQDPYWGALEVKYGYAVTAHKAQGGQWDCVFIDLGLLSWLPTDKAMLRWLYTALTRARERVYLMNAPEGFILPPSED